MTGRATGRFPGFDMLGQARHWDSATAGLIAARMAAPSAGDRFFTPAERASAAALLNLLTGQNDQPLGVPVADMVDARLAAGETDGWHYADMPEDGQAWRDTLGYIDKDAHARYGMGFADVPERDQAAIIQAIQDGREWHGLSAPHVWSLWTRYACTALYSHPYAWSELGFPGPAYPRGYKNAGLGQLEPFEVADRRPAEDPVGDDG
ncbi:MAG TPA: gluconate 2-dehydrogenase subunit 3 family protein [Trebonia sp.]|nr:gluconate 2-dehydrogenase subunit 3 family protein [Trebonia sp.]